MIKQIKATLLFFLGLFSLQTLISQNIDKSYIDSFEDKIYVSEEGDILPYRIYIPKVDSHKKLPVLLFLHGRGESGNDNIKQFTHGGKWLYDYVTQHEPAILILPQCPTTSYWSNVIRTEDCKGKPSFIFTLNDTPTVAMRLLQELWNQKIAEFTSIKLIDTQKLYLGGISMGGMGSIEFTRRNPGVFASVFPICGGGIIDNLSKHKNTNFWFFHGLRDDIVSYHYSWNLHKLFTQEGIGSRYTLFEDANHNAWDPTIEAEGILDWVFSNSIGSTSEQSLPSEDPEN